MQLKKETEPQPRDSNRPIEQQSVGLNRLCFAPGAHPLLVSHNLCPVPPVWATTGNQGCHSYSPVAHGLRNTRPEKAGSFLSVILRQTIIGGHGNRCQLHPKLASLCRFRATLNRYLSLCSVAHTIWPHPIFLQFVQQL